MRGDPDALSNPSRSRERDTRRQPLARGRSAMRRLRFRGGAVERTYSTRAVPTPEYGWQWLVRSTGPAREAESAGMIRAVDRLARPAPACTARRGPALHGPGKTQALQALLKQLLARLNFFGTERRTNIPHARCFSDARRSWSACTITRAAIRLVGCRCADQPEVPGIRPAADTGLLHHA